MHLRGEGLEIALPALEATLLEELARAVEEAIRILEVLLHLDDPRLGEIPIVQAFLETSAREFRDRLIALLGADIAVQAFHGRGLTLLRHTFIEQVVKAGED